jgi:hypothetical protein
MQSAQASLGNELLNESRQTTLRGFLSHAFGALVSRCFFAVLGPPE